MMKVGRKRKGKAEIPTASMSDIAFLLIVFFMATTKFDVKEGIKIVLPAAAPEGSQQAETIQLGEDKMTRLQIEADGTIAVNKEAPREIENHELDNIIMKKLQENNDMIFKVITDRDAEYSQMIRVVDRLKSQRAEKISIHKLKEMPWQRYKKVNKTAKPSSPQARCQTLLSCCYCFSWYPPCLCRKRNSGWKEIAGQERIPLNASRAITPPPST